MRLCPCGARVVVVALNGGGGLVATEGHFEATLLFKFLLKLKVEVSEARDIFLYLSARAPAALRGLV